MLFHRNAIETIQLGGWSTPVVPTGGPAEKAMGCSRLLPFHPRRKKLHVNGEEHAMFEEDVAEQHGRGPIPAAEGQPLFCTIGHSTRSIPVFVDLLRIADVQLVVDVRSIRRSRTNPHYNEEVLGSELEPYQIGYLYIPELGGRRKVEKGISQDVNAFWNNRSFHNYADYALTPEFRRGLEQLLCLGASRRCAIMCAESVWWRCHRRIIADYLLQRGMLVDHLMEGGRSVPAELTRGAVVLDEWKIIYPGADNQPCCCPRSVRE